MFESILTAFLKKNMQYMKKSFVSDRSSRPKVFCKKGVLRNFTKFTGKHLCQSLFFKKVAGLRPATLLKKRLWHSWFPVNFVKRPAALLKKRLWHRCFPVNFVKRPATLLKKRLWHRCFPVNFVKFLRTPFCIEHLWWLLLYR